MRKAANKTNLLLYFFELILISDKFILILIGDQINLLNVIKFERHFIFNLKWLEN
jgi:hypothetical protein